MSGTFRKKPSERAVFERNEGAFGKKEGAFKKTKVHSKKQRRVDWRVRLHCIYTGFNMDSHNYIN